MAYTEHAGRIRAIDNAVITVPHGSTTSSGRLLLYEAERRKGFQTTGLAYYPFTNDEELTIIQGEFVYTYKYPQVHQEYNPDRSTITRHIFSSVNGLDPKNPHHAIVQLGMANNTKYIKDIPKGQGREKYFAGADTAITTSGPITFTIMGTEFIRIGSPWCWKWPEASMEGNVRVPKVFIDNRPTKFYPAIHPWRTENTYLSFMSLNALFLSLLPDNYTADNFDGNTLSDTLQRLETKEKIDGGAFRQKVYRHINMQEFSFYPSDADCSGNACPMRRYLNKLIYMVAGESSGLTEDDYSMKRLDKNDPSMAASMARLGHKRQKVLDQIHNPTHAQTLNAYRLVLEGASYACEQQGLEQRHVRGIATQEGPPGTRIEGLLGYT